MNHELRWNNRRILYELPFYPAHDPAVDQQNQVNMAQQLRASDYLPARYNGENIDEAPAHILSFTDYAELHTLNDAQKIQKFKITLSGAARLWYEGKAFADFDDLKDQFLAYFSAAHTRESAVAAFRSCSLKLSETAEQYRQRVERFADRLGYNAEMVKDQFLAGLPSEVRTGVTMARPQNVNDCVRLTQQFIDLNRPKEVTFASVQQEKEIDTLRGEIQKLHLMQTGRGRQERRGRDTPRESRDNSYTRSTSRDGNARTAPRNRSASWDRHGSRDRNNRRAYNDRRDSRERYDRGRRDSRDREDRDRRDSQERYRSDRNWRAQNARGRPQQRGGYSARGRPPSRVRFRCYRCNGPNHLARDCEAYEGAYEDQSFQ